MRVLAHALVAVPAVLGAGPAPAQGGAALDREVAEALEKARPVLLRHLRTTRGGVLALVCLAALHDGVPVDDPVLARALERLGREPLEGTYGLSLRLMVMAAHPGFPDRERLARRDLALLLERQTTGGFSYTPDDGWWDLSNTQYAALGLRAAAGMDLVIPEGAWRLLLFEIRRAQKDGGGFSYRPGQGDSSVYASMTVAGIAVMAICGQHLELDAAARRALDERIARAWRWVAGSRSLGNPAEEHCFYYHYGLERAAILTDVEEVGGRDWYTVGARMLLARQFPRGGWVDRTGFRPGEGTLRHGHPVDTAFAVLFLRRRFQKLLRPLTPLRPPQCSQLAEEADDAAIRRAVERDARVGAARVPALLGLLRSEVVAQRKAAVLALYEITGRNFPVHPYRDPAASEDAIRAAEEWWKENGGQ